MARSDPGSDAPPADRRLQTPRAAGIAGLAFAALFVTSVVLLRSHPSGGSTASEIRDFYLRRDAGKVALVGVYLAPFSGIAFLWFIAVVRNLIGDREDRFFATVFLGSGLLFVAMLFVAAGLGGALLAAVKFQDQPVPERRDRRDRPRVDLRVSLRLRDADGRRLHDRHVDDRHASRRLSTLAGCGRVRRSAGPDAQRVIHRVARSRLPRLGGCRQRRHPQSERVPNARGRARRLR